MTEHAHNHRPNVRVLHSSPQRTPSSRVSPNRMVQPMFNRITSPVRSSSTDSNISKQNQHSVNQIALSPKDLQSETEGERPQSQMSRSSRDPSSKSKITTHMDCTVSTSKTPQEEQSYSPNSQRRSPSPTNSHSPISGSHRHSSSPNRPTPSPSPILTRPGSANRRYMMGRTNSVSFLDQDDDEEQDDSDVGEDEGIGQ